MPADHTENKIDKMKRITSDDAACGATTRPLAVAGIVVTFMATIALMPLPASANGASLSDREIFACAVENRMGEKMYFERTNDEFRADPFTVGPGEIVKQMYIHRFARYVGRKYTDRATSLWVYAGNTMTGVVLWDNNWPEAKSCLLGAGPGCRLVFENNEVTLLSGTGGKRLLGDLAVKECSKNWNWLPWGLGCTYPKHDHPYVGTIVS